MSQGPGVIRLDEPVGGALALMRALLGLAGRRELDPVGLVVIRACAAFECPPPLSSKYLSAAYGATAMPSTLGESSWERFDRDIDLIFIFIYF